MRNSLEAIVDLIPKLGVPRNVRQLPLDDIITLFDLLMERGNLDTAVDVARDSHNPLLMGRAAYAVLETNPERALSERALSLAYGANSAVLSRLGWMVLNHNPEGAYEAGRKANDKALVEKASEALLQKPHKALRVAREHKDYSLIAAAGERLLGKAPSKVYEAAQEAKNQELLEKSRRAVLKRHLPKNPIYVFELGMNYEDKSLMFPAFDILAVQKPEQASSYARSSGCAELISREGWMSLAEGHVLHAYGVGRKNHDEALEQAARRELLKNPEFVYERLHAHRDAGLATTALEAIARREGIDFGLVKKWYGPNGSNGHLLEGSEHRE